MNATELERRIEELWERREGLSPNTSGDERRVVDDALEALESGAARVAEQGPGGWRVNQWLKKAVLLSFRLTDSVHAGAGRCAGVGQGADEVRGLGREPVP